jgi:serine/threonine protein kinase
MGEGTFGQVLECWDRERKEMVAIKIVRAVNKYSDAAMIEIDVLQKLARNDTAGKHYAWPEVNSYRSKTREHSPCFFRGC